MFPSGSPISDHPLFFGPSLPLPHFAEEQEDRTCSGCAEEGLVKKTYQEKFPNSIMGRIDSFGGGKFPNGKCSAPFPPPRPVGLKGNVLPSRGHGHVSTATRDLWDSLFDRGYRADVAIHTADGGVIYAHSPVLGMASPVLKGMLKHSKRLSRKKTISIKGASRDAVRVFVRFLYSSCYDRQDMEEFVLPLLVLSHTYVVPHLKKACEMQLEAGLLTLENVVDVFQLALLCNCPRLGIISHQMILRNYKAVSATEGWEVMRQSHPFLEQELLDSMMTENNRQKDRIKKLKEEKMYLQLYEAMEALVHICSEGCQTIGPHDKDLKDDQTPCSYAACKGLELLLRHFAACKLRVPGGCIQCKRMWKLLDLHSRICADSELCRVPLCGNFKERVMKQNKKDEIRWKLLVKKILRTKRIGGTPIFATADRI